MCEPELAMVVKSLAREHHVTVSVIYRTLLAEGLSAVDEHRNGDFGAALLAWTGPDHGESIIASGPPPGPGESDAE